MALTSPGVEIKVIDESFYTPAEPGTVPLIVVATAENKQNGSGTGIAPGTLQANAGEVYLISSQRDLVETFGDPVFKTDANSNPIHAGEQNEYGLQAAYSFLGVSNRAYVVRADIDLNELSPAASEPEATPANGTHWLDTQISSFGIFEWNAAPVTARGGQTFTNKVPRIITDATKVDEATGGPTGAVGAVGDYALVVVDTDPDTPALTLNHPNILWFKNRNGNWVKVGSTVPPEGGSINDTWFTSWPTVAGSKANPVINQGDNFTINGSTVTVTLASPTVSDLADDINNASITGITAAAVNGKLEIYCDGMLGMNPADSSQSNAVSIANGTQGTLIAATVSGSALGIKAGVYYAPKLEISKHTQVPQWKLTASAPRPTGSIWIKTTEPNLGSRWRIKRWNDVTKAWERIESPLYDNGHAAVFNLDKVNGGKNLPVGTLYVQPNYTEDAGTDLTSKKANWKVWRRGAAGPTIVRSEKITNGKVSAGTYTLTIAESVVGSAVLGDYDLDGTYSSKNVVFTATGFVSDSDVLANAINTAGFDNIEAEVDSQNRVIIIHTAGGEIRIADLNSALVLYGFTAYDYDPASGTYGQGTPFFFDAPDGDALHDFVISHWTPLVYTASNDAPTRIADEGTLWYSSVVDEVDMMIHDGDKWVGYKTATSPYYSAIEAEQTDPNGPIVSATAPELQSDNTDLVTGDLWVDTSDIENFPKIYKFNRELENYPIVKRWVLLDKTDQSTEDGVIFADARYNTAGANSYEQGSIVDLLESNYVDPDTPDPALYPRGMLLWNLRRSGFNVKEFKRDYIDTAEDNVRYDPALTGGESMADYWPHRWVTASANQVDGAGSFGRKSQRAVVVKKLQAMVNSNEGIRDEDSRIFNLIACPGYPELIGELVSLNYDRNLTAFVVGDSPARLTPDATSLLRWGSNQLVAVEDNDIGAATYDEYMAMFYPWGFTSDNFGNNIVVPPSHMLLRTIAINDQVAYPWFAPAGVRRGGVTNSTAVGYVNGEGEFKSVALNTGQRDTLYEAKVNPITFFSGTGLVNYGQKTRAKAASALDRINVARLVVYLRRQLNILVKPYIFEPNDKITRDEVKGAVESLLLELVGQRALYDYLVVCDETNNTPSRIDRNELWIDIAIEPVKAVEFIYIPLRLKNTGEIKGLGNA